MRRTLVLLVIALSTWAAAADAVVHPFRSQDPVLGVAVAERIAGALHGVELLGPEIAPTLVAPIVVPGGFFNPLVLLTPGPYGRSGVQLMAGAVGVPLVVSGELAVGDDELRLELVASVHGAVRSATVRAPGDDVDLLIRRAAPLVARWAGARPGVPRPLDLRGPDHEAARARALIGAGFPSEALEALDRLADPHEADALLRDDLRHALEGSGAGGAALAAMVSLAAADPELPGAAFARWSAEGGPPAAQVWAGAWARSVGDDAGAERAFAAAAAAYPYGLAAQAADRAAAGDEDGARASLARLAEVDEPAALLAAAFAAAALDDVDAEDRLLASLGRAAPFLTYSFERRSFIAFDRGDALTAASTLAVAVELEPDSDLYWTNLGWAWYLLGFLERSEAASLRALQLDPAQFIARYNLGLVEVVTGRLEAALGSYREALRFDPDVDREAIADLVAAEADYPEAVGVPFALGLLLDQAGMRAEAADAYERYVARVEDEPSAPGADAARAEEAAARIAALRAPLPPIEIVSEPTLSLGRRGPAAEVARPGDPLTVAFEVSTRGDALPRRLDLGVELRAGDGAAVASDEATVDVPSGAIGYVIDVLQIELPVSAVEGRYSLAVTASGDGMEVAVTRELVVAGEPDAVRRLVGRGLVLTALDSGQALVSARDLGLTAQALWGRLLAELHEVAELAEEALPVVEAGRFAGMSGGEAFAASTVADVRDFLDHLLDSGARHASFTFADAYAQWVLEGTP